MKHKHVFVLFILLLFARDATAAMVVLDYSKCRFTIPFSGAGISVAVIDMRAEIRNGDHKPQYVGMMRGGYGNPWNADTRSGQPFADEVSACLSASFAAAGFDMIPAQVHYPDDVTAAMNHLKESDAERKILLVIHEWRSDMITSFTKRWTDVYYDLEMVVLDKQNKKAGTARLNGKAETLNKGGNIKKQKAAPPAELVNQVNALLSDRKITGCFRQDRVARQAELEDAPAGEAAPAAQAVRNNSLSVADELAKYKKLLDDGAITREEYDQQKKKLLNAQ